MRTKWAILLGCFVSSIVLMAALALHARSNHSLKNGFSRLVLPTRLLGAKSINLGNNSYYFAGSSSNTLYLGNYTAPLRLFKTDSELKDTQTFLLRPPKETRMDWPASRISIDSPEINLMEGNTPLILQWSLKDQIFEKFFLNDLHFTKSLAISKESFVLRTYDDVGRQNILTRVSAYVPELKTSRRSLTKQVDGFFCTDGQFLFDGAHRRILYLYYYRNQIVSLDTNLILLSPIATIDTNRFAKIIVDSVPKQRLSTLVSTGTIVNKMATIFGTHLFVWSNVMADNEDPKQFEINAVFDSYSLINGRYEGSFYIPPFRNLKPSGFTFAEKTILGLYQNYLVVYKTEDPLFKN
jgi:hypothetical protein